MLAHIHGAQPGADAELDVIAHHHVEGRAVVSFMVTDVVGLHDFHFVLTILDGFQNKFFLSHIKID